MTQQSQICRLSSIKSLFILTLLGKLSRTIEQLPVPRKCSVVEMVIMIYEDFFKVSLKILPFKNTDVIQNLLS